MGKKIRVWDGSAWQDVSVALPYNAVHSAQASMPSTAVDGQIWLDTDGTLSDTQYIPKTLTSTTGDIIYASSANTPARLGIGSTDQVLKVSGGVPVWSAASAPAFSGVYCTGTANQTLNATTETAITWDTEVYDTDLFHSTITNTTRITIPAGKSGYYAISAKVIWEANGTGGHRTVYLKKNGTTYLHGGTSNTPNSTVGTGVDIVMTVNLTAGDYIEVSGYQNSGGTLPVAKNTSYPASYFIAQYLGA